MSPTKPVQNRRGISLVETMMAIGIVGFIAMAMMTMISNQMSQTKIVENKLDRSELRSLMLQAFADHQTCTWQIKDKGTLDLSATTSLGHYSPTVFPLGSIYLGSSTSAQVLAAENTRIGTRGSSPLVQSIEFRNIYQLDPAIENVAKGEYVIRFEKASDGELSLRPLTVGVILHLDPDSPKGAKRIVSCGFNENPGGAGGMALCSMHGPALQDCCIGMKTVNCIPIAGTQGHVGSDETGTSGHSVQSYMCLCQSKK